MSSSTLSILPDSRWWTGPIAPDIVANVWRRQGLAVWLINPTNASFWNEDNSARPFSNVGFALYCSHWPDATGDIVDGQEVGENGR